MKKRLLAAVLALSLPVGCAAEGGKGEPMADDAETTISQAPTTMEPVPTTAAAPLAAGDVVIAMKADGVPIGDVKIYTAADDPNEQLGRPGGYTSKANFHDTRLEKSPDFDTEAGGSVEVFETSEDAKKRFDYVDDITRGNAMLNEYHWLFGKTFVRVSKALTPDQAAEYEAAAKKAVGA